MPSWSKLYFRCNSFHYLGNWRIDVLMIAGMKSKCADNTEKVHQEVEMLRKLRNWKSLYLQIAPGLCSIIRVEEVEDPLVEAPEKVCEALVLFCQGQGLMPTLNRRGSRPSITFSQTTDSSRSEILRLTMAVVTTRSVEDVWLYVLTGRCRWLTTTCPTYGGCQWQPGGGLESRPERRNLAQRREERERQWERCIITLYYLTHLTNINHQVSLWK